MLTSKNNRKTVFDKEENKNMQNKNTIEETEELFETLFNISSQGILIHDKTIIIYYNPAFAKITGYKNGELIGVNVIDTLVLPEYRELVRDKMVNGFEKPYEINAKHKSGDIFAVMIISSKDVHYKSRNLRLVIVSDITEQKTADKNLQRSEAFLNTIVENIPAMTVVKDTDNFRYVLFNKAGEELLGIREEDVIGKTDFEIFSEKEAKSFRKKDKEVLEKGKLVEFPDQTIQTRHNGQRVITVRKIPIMHKDGKPKYILAIAADMTDWKTAGKEKRKLERQLQQAHKMEAIGSLAGGIAHDFNNILSAIIGFTELSLDDVEKGTHLENNLQEVYAAGTRAKDLVKRILAFARQSDEERKPIQVNLIVKEVLKFIRSSIPATIEIKQNIESESLIMGNSTQIHQILMNLCTNAAHAMENKNGTLDVRLKDITVDGTKNWHTSDIKLGDYIEIKVSDTGTGIQPEIIKNIFEPYFTTKATGEGTGMGLAMVHGIVESYNGKIVVDSAFGEGTIFTICLPVIKKRIGDSLYESDVLPSGTERILFVDDEDPIAKMGGQILSQLGYSVTTRTSSIEALALFKAKPNYFDLVVTDMTMPHMTGDVLATELMIIRPDIPVILCTGYSKKISDKTALENGIKAFAYKPITKADMAKTVRKVLDEANSGK